MFLGEGLLTLIQRSASRRGSGWPITLSRVKTESAVHLTAVPPDELRALGEQTIERARTAVAGIRAGALTGLALLDRYDDVIAELTDLAHGAHLIGQTHPDAELREVADQLERSVQEELTAVELDHDVFQALAELSGSIGADDPGTRHYLSRILRDFRRAGVDRDEATREQVRQIRDRLVRAEQDFIQTIRSDTRTAAFPPSALAGLPADYLRSRPVGADGLVSISTEYPDYVPLLTYCSDSSVRERMWRLFRQRGHPDNIDHLATLLATRHELATRLGYPSWAGYAAEDKMIGSAAAIGDFIERIAAAAADRAGADHARLLARKRRDDPAASTVEPWDVAYLEDRLKAEQFEVDTQAMRPYFEYGRVKAAVIDLVGDLFEIEFRPVDTLPLWHPEVECFEVYRGAELIGRIFLDMHPRPDKFGHAAMFAMSAGKAGLRIPECTLVCNLPRPGASGPALLLPSDVQTFLHEFGHLVHHVLAGAGRWAGTSGCLHVEWDFIEAPSQLLEEWLGDPGTVTRFAVHHESGEPLPAESVVRLRAAQEASKGLEVRRQMYLAALSHQLHAQDPAGVDPAMVDRQAQRRFTPFEPVDGAWMPLSFGHLASYSALYYTYTWSLVIAKDLLTAFTAAGMRDQEVARRYRDRILARGGSAPAAELVEDFLGRPYRFDAYREWLDS